MLKKSLLSLSCAAMLGLAAAPALATSFWLVVPLPVKNGTAPEGDNTESISVTLNPVPALQDTLLKAKVGVAYSRAFMDYLMVTGDPGYIPSAVIWGVAQGALPTGLSLGTDGVVSGTPTEVNPGATFELQATYKGKSGAQSYTIRVGGVSLDVIQISAGGPFSCAVTPAGAVKCWGRGNSGQLGHGLYEDSSVPVQVLGLTSGVQSVATGEHHACAVLVSGGAKCWGWNADGQLGNGLTQDSAVPVTVVGLSNVTKIDASLLNTCAVDGGAAKCWGKNDYGQFGNGGYVSSLTPVTATGLTSGVTDISVSNHTCAVVNGGAKCWGDNSYSQVGNGVPYSVVNEYYAPQDVAGLSSGVSRIEAGYRHTCAVVGGGVKCWGSNYQGQLGINNWDVSEIEFPQNVVGLSSGATDVGAGYQHSCAVVNGGVKCWGDDGYGQLGNGDIWDQGVAPVDAIAAGSRATSVSLYDMHTCAVVDGDAKCWGNNYYGQLGDGTSKNERNAPVFVQP